MKNFGETLSGRVEKVKWWLGIKAKKIVEEKSDDLFGALTASPEGRTGDTLFVPNSPTAEMEVVQNENPSTQYEQASENKDIWSNPEPTAMAA